MKFYADFIIRNIDLTTIQCFAKLICNPDFKKFKFSYSEYAKDYASIEEAQSAFEYVTTNLRKSVIEFTLENLEILKEKEILQKLGPNLLIDVLFHQNEKQKNSQNLYKMGFNQNIPNNQNLATQKTEEGKNQPKNTHKIRELCHDDHIPNESFITAD